MIAYFGGTFDPLHLGHLRVAWEAAERLDCPVCLMPARVPPHRTPPVASAAQRRAILEVALAGQERLRLDARELERPGPSWTVDTLRELRVEHGATAPLVLLMGADAFAGLPTWERWRELLQLAHIGVLTRPGHTGVIPDAVAQAFPDCHQTQVALLRKRAHGLVMPIQVTALDISASQIRGLLAAGRQPRYLLPAAVLADCSLLAPYRDA